MNTSFSIETFGCKVNTYDTGLLQSRLAKAGYLQTSSEPKIHILNTCAVTAEATKEAVRRIRKLKAKNPFCTVVVTGCAAQVDTDHFRNLPGADLVIANSQKGQLEEILKKHFRGELTERVFHSNIFKKEDLEEGGGLESRHTRAFLKIQDGCNSFCTYCVIPFARGKSRSIPISDLVKRVRELEAAGIQEVTLTGVHIGDYEDNLLVLEDLVEALLANTKMPRFRLSSLEPIELTDRLLSLYETSKRLCPHFHMSIQSAETGVLKNMKRKYTEEDVESALLKISQRVPEAFVGMDVIAGFPEESDDQFESTYRRLEKLPWTRLHVFPYSQRPGTKATQMPQVNSQTIAVRSKRLRELSLERFVQQASKQIGTTKKVLLLRNAKGATQGLSRDYWHVTAPDSIAGATGEVSMRITGFDSLSLSRMDGNLTGTLADSF